MEHPSIAGLTPNYGSDVLRRWSLASHVDVPQRILTTLGVDIFKDLRYDTWVLQTIWSRMLNNQRGVVQQQTPFGPIASREIFPLYSFINHSCEPNAEAYPPKTARAIGSFSLVIIAERHIKAGEEIHISYIPDEVNLNRSQRNLALRNWLSGDCKCSRCRREIDSKSSK